MKNLFVVCAVLAGGLGLVYGAPGDGSDGYKPVIKVTTLLRSSVTSAGQPIVYPVTDHPEVTAVKVEIPVGAETGWHKHPFPIYGYLISGDLNVELEGGKINHVKAGEALFEAVNVLHNGRNTGTEPVTLVMFITGEKGEPFTVPAPAPSPKS